VSLGHRLGSRQAQSGEPEARDASDLLALANSAIIETRQFWKDAIGSLDCQGAYAGTVERSMLTLSMLDMRRHGTLAAAGTFGFPESINGKRNWDYRYAWVRDSALVAETAARCGMVEEALGWVRSVLIENKSCDRSPLRLMMALDGSDVDDETVLESWPGYLDSTPVQIGNEASGQLQLDIFGELIMALLTLAKHGAVIDDDMLARTIELLDWLVENWRRPDSSIWELRGSEKHYLFSRLMSWVAFRDGVALMRHHQREVPDSWVTTQSLISQDIEDNFWCPDRNCYMQTNQLPNADSAMIFMRVVGYLNKGDERWEASKSYLRKELVKQEGVLRFPHDADDGFEKNEGTFVLCTTWWIEALWLDGEKEEAVARYERLLSRVGTTGIMAEELGEDGRQLGNLPQAFSHAGLISAALRLRD
jgi:GH15 family glucan-1,4-alpha-glucosidase